MTNTEPAPDRIEVSATVERREVFAVTWSCPACGGKSGIVSVASDAAAAAAAQTIAAGGCVDGACQCGAQLRIAKRRVILQAGCRATSSVPLWPHGHGQGHKGGQGEEKTR